MTESIPDYERFTIKQLQKFCKQRNKPTTYRLKECLIKRLIANDNAALDDEIGEDDLFKFANNYTEGEKEENQSTTMAAINFKDIEGSQTKFTGTAGQNCEKWFESFEELSAECKWTDAQKFFYTKRLLDGVAKKNVQRKLHIKSYVELKTFLLDAYKNKTSISELTQVLRNKKKTEKETCMEYLFDMLTIGEEQLDDVSMIRHIAEGITNDKITKLSFYGAKTIEDLQDRVEAYEALLANHPKTEHHQRDNKRDNNKKNDTKHNGQRKDYKNERCYNCGETGHNRNDCPAKEKGKKCYNCSSFGHISKDCRAPRKQNKDNTTASINVIEKDNEEDMMIPVTMSGKETMALLDTGSPYTVMNLKTYKQLKLNRWQETSVSMKGFAGTRSKARGELQIKMLIQNENYVLRCVIVNDGLMSYDMVLGRNLTKVADIMINDGLPRIVKRCETTQESEDFMMMIEPDNDKEPVERLSSILAIENDHYRKVITEMVKTYEPRRDVEAATKMEIVLTDNVPVHQNPRRLAHSERQIVQEMIDEFLRDGTIRMSKSPYASPILLRKKPNGKYRLCVDYRKINEKIVKDRYPLPLVEDSIDSLHKQRVFSSIDLKNGFHHVEIEEKSRQITAFVTPDGQYEYCKAPFGLCNSPAIFQRFINNIFHEAQRAGLVQLYLDDVLIPAENEEMNLVKLKKVFEIAAGNGLVINFEKCKFLTTNILFLGYRIGGGEIRPSEGKLKAVKNFPQPKNEKAVQSFLGLTGFFRKFIDKYSTIARPLTQLLRDEVKFKFGPNEVEAYEMLKNLLCSDAILRIYNPKAETELHTDASMWGYGGCLLQRQSDDNLFHPIYYLSFKTTEAEQKLHSYELETLAVVKCVRRLRHYLLGIRFKVVTDCQAFQLTMKKKDAVAKIARWALELEQYDLEVVHKPGKSMKHVDALSRCMMVIEDGILHQIKATQTNDEQCKIIKQLIDNKCDTDYVERGGVLYHHNDGYYRLKVPSSMVDFLLKQIHGDTHLSRERMEHAVKQDYHIDDAGKVIDKMIKNCITCILATKKRGKKDGFLHSIDKFDMPLHTYHMDHCVDMASTAKNYKHILVVIDGFTKFTWLYPTKTTTSAETIRKLQQQQEIFANPTRIVADKGSAFISKDFEDYCDEQDIHLHLITTATPRGNGQVERINAVVKATVTKLALKDPLKWYQHVGRVQRAINGTITRSTGRAPFSLMFGTKMKNPEDVELMKVMEDAIINDFDEHRVAERAEAATKIHKLQAENAQQFNKKRKAATLYILDELVAIERVRPVKGGKFHPQMLGPYRVVRVLRNDRYEVEKVGLGEGPIRTSVPADRMKPWTDGE